MNMDCPYPEKCKRPASCLACPGECRGDWDYPWCQKGHVHCRDMSCSCTTLDWIREGRREAFKRIDWWRNFGWAGCIVMLFGVMALSGVVIAVGLAMSGLALCQIGPRR